MRAEEKSRKAMSFPSLAEANKQKPKAHQRVGPKIVFNKEDIKEFPLMAMISSTASEVIRRSELCPCMHPQLFPPTLIQSLCPRPKVNPFASSTTSLCDIMGDFFDCVKFCDYSWSTFGQITPFPVVYHASAEALNPKDFHDAVDHEAPLALLVFFKVQLIIGVTYCKPLTETRMDGQDLTCGYFSLWRGEFNSFIALDHTLVYTEKGFQLGREPVLSLDLTDLHKSTTGIEIGQYNSRTVSDMVPQWLDLISDIAVVKLLPGCKPRPRDST